VFWFAVDKGIEKIFTPDRVWKAVRDKKLSVIAL
jgi:hypothetical protein